MVIAKDGVDAMVMRDRIVGDYKRSLKFIAVDR